MLLVKQLLPRRKSSFAGGYAFFETSQLPNVVDASNTVSAMIISPVLESTGSTGFCVNFRYSTDATRYHYIDIS